ncbi:hypothetical protein [uncultured Paraglaciecola sp.]|uniref:hypothetical protein n=1 Tax=uncultured Paraglaciecola sp. TaxID=1765024 RepID=UPI00259905BA|nr:hypothetical protein [uncultured Paraglaciecola sp.]
MNYLWNLIFKRKLGNKAASELISVLEETLKFLEASEDSIWSDMEVKQTVDLINNAIQALKTTRRVRISKLYYIFLPTAPLQEISIENGWAEEFLELAGKFDICMARYC